MTVGIVLMKGLPGRHEHTFKFLMDMKKKRDSRKEEKCQNQRGLFQHGVA